MPAYNIVLSDTERPVLWISRPLMLSQCRNRAEQWQLPGESSYIPYWRQMCQLPCVLTVENPFQKSDNAKSIQTSEDALCSMLNGTGRRSRDNWPLFLCLGHTDTDEPVLILQGHKDSRRADAWDVSPTPSLWGWRGIWPQLSLQQWSVIPWRSCLSVRLLFLCKM